MATLTDAVTARLDTMVRRFDEIEAELANPPGGFDQAKYTALVKERCAARGDRCAPIASCAASSARSPRTRRSLRDGDAEMRELAEEEVKALRERLERIEDELKSLMIPRDPNDDRDIFIEIRAGAGGDEAAIFAGDLARMYMRYAETTGMKTELISESESDAGGYKEIVFAVKGAGAYRSFKHESGVHRVQRVPATEAQGRMHTSTATVAVLPQVEDDVEIEIRSSDLQIDTYKSSGRRRTVRQQDRVGDPHHARAQRRHRGFATGTLADAESREGDADAARHPGRAQAPRARRSDGLDPAQPSRHRRSLREDPHL